MKRASYLTKDQLVDIVEQIKAILFLDVGETGDFWNPDKEWGTETIEYVAKVLEDNGLAPVKK